MNTRLDPLSCSVAMDGRSGGCRLKMPEPGGPAFGSASRRMRVDTPPKRHIVPKTTSATWRVRHRRYHCYMYYGYSDRVHGLRRVVMSTTMANYLSSLSSNPIQTLLRPYNVYTSTMLLRCSLELVSMLIKYVLASRSSYFAFHLISCLGLR